MRTLVVGSDKAWSYVCCNKVSFIFKQSFIKCFEAKENVSGKLTLILYPETPPTAGGSQVTWATLRTRTAKLAGGSGAAHVTKNRKKKKKNRPVSTHAIMRTRDSQQFFFLLLYYLSTFKPVGSERVQAGQALRVAFQKSSRKR